jgi:hypothetical protein
MSDNHTEEGPKGPDRPTGPRAHAGGFTLDLSAGKPSTRRRRKAPPTVVQQTINLSTRPAPESKMPAPATPTPLKPAHPAGKGRPRSDGGHSLADLLDPETLARLRRER